MTILGELLSDFCKNHTEFYKISLKNLLYLPDFSPQLMACMYRYYSIFAVNNKGADQTARMRMLICAFVVRIWHKTSFLMMWLI